MVSVGDRVLVSRPEPEDDWHCRGFSGLGREGVVTFVYEDGCVSVHLDGDDSSWSYEINELDKVDFRSLIALHLTPAEHAFLLLKLGRGTGSTIRPGESLSAEEVLVLTEKVEGASLPQPAIDDGEMM